MSDRSPLGEKTNYRSAYSPDLLHALARVENRRTLGLGNALPFSGEDIWNAYELCWRNSKDKPVVAAGEFRIPADTPNIIESKSMKLYLNGFAMMRHSAAEDVAAIIRKDLSAAAGGAVAVRLLALADIGRIDELPGVCIDTVDADCAGEAVDPDLLASTGGEIVAQDLHSHLLRSNCPVTGQPDTGSILIRYRGKPIDRAALLRYLVSYRHHDDFHENCVERIFLDVKKRCGPEQLSVYARYNRRGGLDINPFRSDFETSIANLRLWRQ